MNKVIRAIPIVVVLHISGCGSTGPTIVLETPEPAEDFVVVCKWVKDGILNIHGGKKLSDERVFVTESGKEVDCGFSIWGGEGGASILHPLYTEMQGEEINGVIVIRPKTKLDILDEKKAMFEAGYWDKYKNPGAVYSRNLAGCGFPYQYFDYYSKVQKVSLEHFKQRYHKPMLECFKRSFPVTRKYNPQIGKQLPDAEEWMRRMWEPDRWSEYR